MGKKDSNSPDYEAAARAQGDANERVNTNQTFANRATQHTPFGSQEWTPGQGIDPATGLPVTTWTSNTTLTPRLQEALDSQINAQLERSRLGEEVTGRLRDDFSTPMDWSGAQDFGEVPGAVYAGMSAPVNAERLNAIGNQIQNPNSFRQRGEDAAYSQAMSRLNPAFAEESRALEVKLRNQGLNPEDAAWQASMGTTGRSQTDARMQAIWGASAAGREESALNYGQALSRNQNEFGQNQAATNQNFGQNMAVNQNTFGQGMATIQENTNQNYRSAEYANTLRQQQRAEMMQQRGFALNEANALLSGQQVGMPQMPTYNTAGRAEAAPTYQAAVDQGNYDQANQQSLWGGVGDLAGAGIGAYGNYAGMKAMAG